MARERRRRWALGLRGRIVGALLLSSVATLGVAALSLLSPLERRLRSREVAALVSTSLAARGSFATLPPEATVTGSPALKQAARSLARRTGGRVIVLDRNLHVVVATDPDAGDRLYEDVERAYLEGRTNSSVDSEDGVATARVATPVKIGGRSDVIAVRKPIAEVRAAARAVERAFGTAAIAAIAFALLAGVGLATTLVRRLRRLRDASLRLAELGPAADVPVDPRPARDEVGDLARAFATMQARLRQQEEVRRAFVATASHELRTPLASLRGMLELLEEDLADEHPDIGDARELTGRARGQAHRLARLAADLLDLSRLDAEVPLRSEPVELGELCRAVLAEFDLRAEEAEVDLRSETDAPGCWALADPGSVARIVRILIDNALRVTPPGGSVRVALGREHDVVHLCVDDDGPGVPAAERLVIFERFQRGSTTGGEPGFGLGLALGRELAARMGGGLRLRDSDSDSGSGASFALELPADPQPEPHEEPTTLTA